MQYIFPYLFLGIVQYGLNTRGRPQLMYNDFVYHVNKRTWDGKKTFWICARRYGTNCKSRCITFPDGSVNFGNVEHNHPAEKKDYSMDKFTIIDADVSTKK